jgi:hypothetical protein
MPLTGNGTPAVSVPLDALDAEEIAGLLADAAAVTGALAGQPAAEAACADAAPGPGRPGRPAHRPRGRRSRPGRRDRRAHRHPAPLTPAPAGTGTARTLRTQKRKGTRASPRPRHYRLLCLMTDGNGSPCGPRGIRQQAPVTAQDAGKTGTHSISPGTARKVRFRGTAG